ILGPEMGISRPSPNGTLAAPRRGFSLTTQDQKLETLSLLMQAASTARASRGEVIQRCRDTRDESRLLLWLLDQILIERNSRHFLRTAACRCVAADDPRLDGEQPSTADERPFRAGKIVTIGTGRPHRNNLPLSATAA